MKPTAAMRRSFDRIVWPGFNHRSALHQAILAMPHGSSREVPEAWNEHRRPLRAEAGPQPPPGLDGPENARISRSPLAR